MPISKYIPTAFVSTLPSSPIDGQEIYYQASGVMAASGINWHLRYNASSSSAYKWEFIGGSDIWTLGSVTGSTVSADTWTTFSGAPSITVLLAGDYFVKGQSSVLWTTQSTSYTGIATSSSATPPEATTSTNQSVSGGWARFAQEGVLTGVTANSAITMRHKSFAANTANGLSGTTMSLTPIRVG